MALANFLQKSPDRQTNVDVSGNELNEQQIEHILAAIKNRTLFALDLRGNPGYKDLQIKSDRYDTPGKSRLISQQQIQLKLARPITLNYLFSRVCKGAD